MAVGPMKPVLIPGAVPGMPGLYAPVVGSVAAPPLSPRPLDPPPDCSAFPLVFIPTMKIDARIGAVDGGRYGFAMGPFRMQPIWNEQKWTGALLTHVDADVRVPLGLRAGLEVVFYSSPDFSADAHVALFPAPVGMLIDEQDRQGRQVENARDFLDKWTGHRDRFQTALPLELRKALGLKK